MPDQNPTDHNADKRVLVDQPSAYVTRVMINRPEAKNAVDESTRLALIEAIDRALNHNETRALLLCGAEGIFCAGGDLASMRGMTLEQARERMQSGHQLVKLLWHADIPVVAAVEKYAIGAGAGLALLADYVIAGESALMAFPFLQFGLVPDWGSAQMLIRRCGWAQAKRLILDKASVKGEQLLEQGIADRIVKDDEVLAIACQQADTFAHYPQQAFSLFKARMKAWPESFQAALAAEEDDQPHCFLSAEFEEGLSAFQEKRSADFIKHRNQD